MRRVRVIGIHSDSRRRYLDRLTRSSGETEGSAVSKIQTICETILAHHRRYDRKIAGMLEAGLAEPMARQLTATIPILIPDSVYEFYAWRDGYSGPVGGRAGGAFFPGWYMMKMKKCIDVYQMCCDEPMDMW